MASVLAAQSAVVSSPVALHGASTSEPMSRAFAGFRPAGVSLLSARRSEWAAKTVNNGSRVNCCMQVVDPLDNEKFETLSYLPPLDSDSIAKEVEYLLKNGWIPCLEFDHKGTVYRQYLNEPGYYDGRYWTMWKLPMFGCQAASQVLSEIEECKKAYPKAYIRILGFDQKRQVQCSGFLVQKP